MNKRKIITDILVIIMAFSLFITWYGKYNANVATTSTPSQKSYKVYLITMDKADQFWYYIDQGATDMAIMLGVTYLWDAPEQKDTQRQIEVLNNAVNDGADAIMIAANDPIRISPAIEDAKARNVKIIYVDSPANAEAIITLATDNYHAGVDAAETMILALEEVGIESGTIGIIGVNAATDTTIKRVAGFRETIEADGRFTLLDTEYRNGDPIASQEAATNFITQNPDLVGLFGTNEGSTIGVGNAIKTNNNKIIGIGFDKSDEILKLINDGSIKAVMVQNPYTMGYLGMAEAVAALNGQDTGPLVIDTGVSVLTKR